MGQLGNRAQRVKNIVDGKFTAKSKLQTGYTKEFVEHVEGDEWIEDDKTWTIKNGIKQSVTKMDEVRALTRKPLCCPECGHLMKGTHDKKFYAIKKKCFNCVIIEDTNKKIAGTFEQEEKEFTTKNAIGWLGDVETQIDEYIESQANATIVTENGQIEDWSKGTSKEKLKEIFSTQINEFRTKLHTYIQEGKGETNE